MRFKIVLWESFHVTFLEPMLMIINLTVIINIRVTNVTLAVSICILLPRVVSVGAIVASVASVVTSVLVAVRLVGIWSQGTVVLKQISSNIGLYIVYFANFY